MSRGGSIGKSDVFENPATFKLLQSSQGFFVLPSFFSAQRSFKACQLVLSLGNSAKKSNSDKHFPLGIVQAPKTCRSQMC
jgi:hypothetical protein